MPRTGMMSLGAWGKPCRGPRLVPRASSASRSAACARSASRSCGATMALTVGLQRSIWPRYASSTSTHDTCRPWMAADSAVASRDTISEDGRAAEDVMAGLVARGKAQYRDRRPALCGGGLVQLPGHAVFVLHPGKARAERVGVERHQHGAALGEGGIEAVDFGGRFAVDEQGDGGREAEGMLGGAVDAHEFAAVQLE